MNTKAEREEIREQIAVDKTNIQPAIGWVRYKLEQALDTIDEQQAEIEFLKSREAYDEQQMKIMKMETEIERLNKEIDQFYSSVPTANDIK